MRCWRRTSLCAKRSRTMALRLLCALSFLALAATVARADDDLDKLAEVVVGTCNRGGEGEEGKRTQKSQGHGSAPLGAKRRSSPTSHSLPACVGRRQGKRKKTTEGESMKDAATRPTCAKGCSARLVRFFC